MNNIVIGFSKPKNHKFPWFSWLIRLFQKTQYSHVYIRWDAEGINEKICYQASGLEVNFIGQKMFDQHVQPIAEYRFIGSLSKATKQKLLKFCISNSGIPYGIKQVFGIALVIIFKLNTNPISDKKTTYVCSELVGTILQEVFGISSSVDLDCVMPKDIENMIKIDEHFEKLPI